jgi:membrane associated rhomboid family serine protease
MLAMFGSRLEYTLGRRNFLFLFLISVAGGAILQTIANMVTINAASGMYFPLDTTSDPVGRVQFTLDHGFEVTNVFTGITIGASAGVFGCMVAFACLFPYQRLSLFLIPISVSARLLIILYLVLEVYNGISTSTSHIAHFAHLGGALFGFLMTRYWKKTMFL